MVQSIPSSNTEQKQTIRESSGTSVGNDFYEIAKDFNIHLQEGGYTTKPSVPVSSCSDRLGLNCLTDLLTEISENTRTGLNEVQNDEAEDYLVEKLKIAGLYKHKMKQYILSGGSLIELQQACDKVEKLNVLVEGNDFLYDTLLSMKKPMELADIYELMAKLREVLKKNSIPSSKIDRFLKIYLDIYTLTSTREKTTNQLKALLWIAENGYINQANCKAIFSLKINYLTCLQNILSTIKNNGDTTINQQQFDDLVKFPTYCLVDTYKQICKLKDERQLNQMNLETLFQDKKETIINFFGFCF